MTYLIDSLPFPVLLDPFAQKKAKKFRQLQPNSKKAEQVYLNTLTVYAVDFYLKSFGFEPDLANSDSWNPAMQTLVSTADLEVRNIGRVECVPILKAAQVAHIPLAALDDSVAFVFVQFNETLTEAMVVGFLETAETEELLLDDLELREIDAFPEYLHNYLHDHANNKVSITPRLVEENYTTHPQRDQQTLSNLKPKAPTNLISWLRGVFDEIWLPAQDIFGSLDLNSGLSTTSAGMHSANPLEIDEGRSQRIDVGEQGKVILTVSLTEGKEELDILVDLRREEMTLLPPTVELALIHPGKPEIRAFTTEPQRFLQLRLLSSLGRRFSIRVTVGEFCITEAFQT